MQKVSENPYATLLTFFMNAVEEHNEAIIQSLTESELKRVIQYVPLKALPCSMYEPQALLRSASRACVRDGDMLFDKYSVNLPLVLLTKADLP